MFIRAWSFFQNQYFDDVIYENGTAAYIYDIYAPPPNFADVICAAQKRSIE